MAGIDIYGTATGSSLGESGGANLNFDIDGTVTLNLADGKPLLVKDDAGAILWRLDESSKAVRVARVALAAVDTGGGVFAWQNPESTSIIISRVILDVTTQSAGACTVDVGTTATNATTSSDNFIDGASVAAVALLDNLGDAGTNGKAKQKLASGKWVTGSRASGASSGLVGYAYIYYILI